MSHFEREISDIFWIIGITEAKEGFWIHKDKRNALS